MVIWIWCCWTRDCPVYFLGIPLPPVSHFENSTPLPSTASFKPVLNSKTPTAKGSKFYSRPKPWRALTAQGIACTRLSFRNLTGLDPRSFGADSSRILEKFCCQASVGANCTTLARDLSATKKCSRAWAYKISGGSQGYALQMGSWLQCLCGSSCSTGLPDRPSPHC